MIKRNVKYIIHACKEREWYVNKHLVPSMVKQGIQKRDIRVWMDSDGIGNQKSFVNCCKWIAENQSADESIWHLQDDVVISKKFAEVTSKQYDGLVAGFCNNLFDGERTNYIGKSTNKTMWFSFQCILIPNKIAMGFADWYENVCLPNGLYPELINSGRHDDSLFREYISAHENVPTLNLMPNIVDHIDFMIGGTVCGTRKIDDRRQSYWRDDALNEAVDELKNWFADYGKTNN